MKKNRMKWLLGVCLLITVFLAIVYMGKKSVVQENDGSVIMVDVVTTSGHGESDISSTEQEESRVMEDNGNAEDSVIVDASEQWLCHLEENDAEVYRKLGQLEMAWLAEYELYILNKYDGWTEEQYKKRIFELDRLMDKSEDQRAEQWDLLNLSVPRHRAERREIPPHERERANDMVMVGPRNNKELRKVKQMLHTCRYEGFSMTDEDREYLNAVIERLNQAGKTNDLLRNYWQLTYGD